MMSMVYESDNASFCVMCLTGSPTSPLVCYRTQRSLSRTARVGGNHFPPVRNHSSAIHPQNLEPSCMMY